MVGTIAGSAPKDLRLFPSRAAGECARCERGALQPDPSFRRLLGEPQWRSLVPAVRERLSWKPAADAELRYVGRMAVVRSSRVGWLVAQLFRLIGTPLAPHRGTEVPVAVTLRLAADGTGVVWHRL